MRPAVLPKPAWPRSRRLRSRPAAAAGSLRPEIAAADYIAAQMESIGLEVEKVPVTVDKWQFNDASLTMEGTDISIMPASYAASSSRCGTPLHPARS